jgi:hypothetical protein
MAEKEWEQEGIKLAPNGKRRNTFAEARKIPVLPLKSFNFGETDVLLLNMQLVVILLVPSKK